MKKSNISTLKELQDERRRLVLMKEVTKREISHSLGLMRSKTKSFTLSNVAVPVGVTAAVGMMAQKAMSSDDELQTVEVVKNNSVVNTVIALIPFAMKFFESQKDTES